MTRDGWNDFNAGWSGGALRIGTIRAPGEHGFWRDAGNGNRDGRAPPAMSQPGGQWQFGVDERGKERLNSTL